MTIGPIQTPRLASEFPLGSTVRLGPDEGVVVHRWTYSLQIRTKKGLISGSTSLIVDNPDIEAMADKALE
jgi:predicted transcriptional regulator